VRRRFRIDIPESAWAEADIPAHLRTRISVIGPDEEELAAGRDLLSLKKKKWDAQPVPAGSERWREARERWERQGITHWDIEVLPESVEVGPFVTAYPGLVSGARGIDIQLFASREPARESHCRGVRALLEKHFERDLDFLRKYLVVPPELENLALYFGGKAILEKAKMEALLRDVLQKDLRTREAYEAYAAGLNRALNERGHLLNQAVAGIMTAYHRVSASLGGIGRSTETGPKVRELLEGWKQELARLVPDGFLTGYSLDRLGHLPRYLEALALRAERGRVAPAKDRSKSEQALPFIRALEVFREENLDAASPEKRAAVDELRWMLEEFKVSLFAPELKTPVPISAKRLSLKIGQIRKMT
jgi:ATP-dependent helicase HrpA